MGAIRRGELDGDENERMEGLESNQKSCLYTKKTDS